jgi:small-conductance mechanosensitive channel
MSKISARVSYSIALCLLLVSFAPTLHAQENAAGEQTLRSLYTSLARYPGDAYLEKRIAEERERIRSVFEKEVQDIIDAASAENQEQGGAADLPTALDRQLKLVSTLEERRQEAVVDLDLLAEEEKKYYLEPSAGTGAVEEYRLTQNHPELQAKKAMLEERITALNAALPLQNDRLSKLRTQYRLEQFAVFIQIGITITTIVFIIALERLIRKKLLSRIKKHTSRYLATKFFTVTVYTVAGVWLLSKYFAEHPNVIASFAIVGAGLAIALQDVVKDIVGWLIILQKRPFSLGQRIAIGPYTGDVIDIGLLRTALLEVGTSPLDTLERTGKTLYIPNALVLTHQVLNYNTTSDFTRSELLLTVTYESNWKKAETILKDILASETNEFAEKEYQQSKKRTWRFYVHPEPRTPQVYMDLGASGIVFTLRFIAPIGMRRNVVTAITRKILERFGKEKSLELAYPTTRVLADGAAGSRTGDGS